MGKHHSPHVYGDCDAGHDGAKHGVTFGAVGTPVLVGIRGGLQGVHVEDQLEAVNMDFLEYLHIITAEVASLHTVAGILICGGRRQNRVSDAQEGKGFPSPGKWAKGLEGNLGGET